MLEVYARYFDMLDPMKVIVWASIIGFCVLVWVCTFVGARMIVMELFK